MVVEHLNLLLVRLINGYHTGTFAEPIAWNASAQTQTTEGETES